MRLYLALILLTSGVTIATTVERANAAECERTSTTIIRGFEFTSTVTVTCPGSTGDDPQVVDTSQDPSELAVGTLLPACLATTTLLGADPELCSEPEGPAVVTPGLVAAAFADTPVPPATLQVQPPNGRTLVNFDTNFFTVREPFTRTVTLLGQAVELRITPAQFTWRFGDGTDTTTTTPGAAYPDLQVTHDYQRTGDYTPSVDTTYRAEWRLAGGAWRPVPGTVTIAGEPVALTAVEAQPTLVSYG